MDSADSPYYDYYLNSYGEKYQYYHGYFSLIICTFGVVANLVNIAIFTRKSMVSSRNIILTALAAVDLLIVLTYIPLVCMYYIPVPLRLEDKFSHNQAYCALVLYLSFLVNHFISLWLAVTLAVWRFLAIWSPLSAVRLLTVKRARGVVVVIYCLGLCFSIPTFMTYSVVKMEYGNTTFYDLGQCELSTEHDFLLSDLSYCLFITVMQILPWILIVFFTVAWIIILHKARARRRNLTALSGNDAYGRKTNNVLLTILLVFIVSEAPEDMLLLLTEILGPYFKINVGNNIAPTLILIDLLSHSINFIIYYTMISKYRKTFNSIFNRINNVLKGAIGLTNTRLRTNNVESRM